MIRPQLRLSTLVLLILVAALSFALIAQWKRERALRVELEIKRQVAEVQARRAEAARAMARGGPHQDPRRRRPGKGRHPSPGRSARGP